MVMIGFKPSFFLFLFIAEFPLAAAAGVDAPCADFCAKVSFACCDPFIVREGEIDSSVYKTGSGDGARARVAVLSIAMSMGSVGKGKVGWRGVLDEEKKLGACPENTHSSVSVFDAQEVGSWQVNMPLDLIRRRRSGSPAKAKLARWPGCGAMLALRFHPDWPRAAGQP